MRYVIIVILVTSTCVLGIVALDYWFAHKNKNAIVTFREELVSIDNLMTSGKYKIALDSIEDHLGETGVGYYQVNLKARQLICAANLDKLYSAQSISEELIITYPFIRTIHKDLLEQKLASSGDYIHFGNVIIEFSRTLEDQTTEPMGVPSLDQIRPKHWLQLAILNFLVIAFYERWRRKRLKRQTQLSKD